MDWLIHVANVLYLFSYLVKDILWLRALSLVAGFVLLAFSYFRPEPLWVSIAWNIVFASINTYQIHVLLLERRPVKMSEREQRLYQLVFRSLTPREFVKLLAQGSWEEATPEERMVHRGRALDRVMVILSGATQVEVDGVAVAALSSGQFIGEMSFLTGDAPTADVVAREPTLYVAWPKRALTDFLRHNAPLRAALQGIIGTDLVGKLRR